MFPPGAHIGLLGGGQLARMTALAARRMGYRLSAFDPAGEDAPAAPVCDRVVRAPYDDAAALAEFARGVDVVTFEFENIPAASLEMLEPVRPVRPGWRVLEICQNREREKRFLQRHGFPHAALEVVTSAAGLAEAVSKLGAPCVLKTAEAGYDGKGQLKIGPGSDLAVAWQEWSGGRERRGVLEAWVDYAAELSVICARNPEGVGATFPVFENIHTAHILDFSMAPARFDPTILAGARALAEGVTECLGVVGLLAVEMFLTRSGTLLVNELAPRPHNSGHLTFDAGMTSQFEQHARAVCGLPLGRPDLLCPAVMVNLLGNLWSGESLPPSWEAVLAEPSAKLHLYGKLRAKPGRKMGHFCVLDADVEGALRKARAIKARLEEERSLLAASG